LVSLNGMANRKTNIAGLIAELKVQLRLADDPNTIVFTPLGGNGPVDIVTLNLTTGEYQGYDVKCKNYRKKDTLIKMVMNEKESAALYIEPQLQNKKN